MTLPTRVVDVGGTWLRWADWTREDGVGSIHRDRSPSLANDPAANVGRLRERLVARLAAIVDDRSTVAVSVGAALDERRGVTLGSAPLWGADQTPFDLRGALEAVRPNVRWVLVDDLTAAALCLADTDAARDSRKVLAATVSSGVACRVLDRRTGTTALDPCGLQGQIGHLPSPVTLNGHALSLPCDCGGTGHVASVASGPGLRRLAAALRECRPQAWIRSPLSRDATKREHSLPIALDAEDPVAMELLDLATAPLADVLRTALCLDPEIDLIAVTGGVAEALSPWYRAALMRHLDNVGIYLSSDHCPGWINDRILVGAAGTNPCLVGAGLATVGA